jgi:hypothetical protein
MGFSSSNIIWHILLSPLETESVEQKWFEKIVPMEVCVHPVIFDKEKSIASLSTPFMLGVKWG